MLLPQSVIRITLDVREVEKQLSFAIKQNDSVRRLVVTLTDKGKPYLLGVGCYAVFTATTSKNTTISNGCQIKNNEIIYDLSASDTAVVGRMDCDITIFGASDEMIASPNFTINVYKSKMDEIAGDVVPSDDFAVLKGLIGEANSRIAEIDAILKSDGKTIDDAMDQAISNIEERFENAVRDINNHTDAVLENMPDTYVELSNDVSKTQKEGLTHLTGTPIVDNTVAYVKNVPAKSLPAVKINKVGGMTKRSENLTTAKAVYNGAYGYAEMVVDGRNCIRMTSGQKIKITPFSFKANTQYTVSFYSKAELNGEVNTGNYVFTFYYTDGTSQSVQSTHERFLWELRTLTSAAGKTVSAIGVEVHQYKVYDYIDIDTFMLNEGTEAKPYVPFFKGFRSAPTTEIVSEGANLRKTLLIPQAVRNLDGYGWGINESVYNYIDFEKKAFVKTTDKIVLTGEEVIYLYAYEGMNGVSISDLLPYKALRAIGICSDSDKVGNYFETNAVWLGVNSNVIYWIGVLDRLGYTGDYNGVMSFKDYLAQRYADGNPVTIFYEVEEPIITDISDKLPVGNYIEIQEGGTLTFVNEHGYAVPSEIIYYLNVVSGVFDGDRPALKIGDTIISEAQLKMLLENGGGSISKIADVKILASAWVGEQSPYSQVVEIAGVTENSQVNLTPSVEQLAIFHNKDLAFVTENEGGIVTVYAIGDKPQNDYTIQATITEVYV